MNKKVFFKNFSYSAFANGIVLLVSVFSTLIVPKLLGVREYSFWQLYVFYSNYIGFFHFGWADGIYLLQGGKLYRELDKQDLAAQFRLYILFELLIAIAFIFYGNLVIEENNKSYIVTCTGICLFIILLRTFLQYLLQATERISEYAKNIIFERTIYVIEMLWLFISGRTSYQSFIVIDLIAKLAALIYIGKLCSDIIFFRVNNIWAAVPSAWNNIKAGIKIMLATISGSLLIGITKMFVERHWGVEMFGKASFAIAVSSMVMVFISAVSIVLYPLLRNISGDQLKSVYKKLRIILVWGSLGVLGFYYPMRLIVSSWLPQYSESLRYMAILFPMCVFVSKSNMLANTYFKALRLEMLMLKINVVAVLFALLYTYIVVVICNSLFLALLGILLSAGFKGILEEIYLDKYLHLGLKKNLAIESVMIFLFCVLSWSIDGWWSLCAYFLVYIVYSCYILPDTRFCRKKK